MTVRPRRKPPSATEPQLYRTELVLVLLLVVAATWLRLYDLGGKSLWGDEMNMVRFMTGERDLAKSSGNALGYLPVLRVAARLGGSDFGYRLPAALAGMLTIPLLYVVGRQLFGSRTGLIAAALLTISPIHLAHSQEVHSYAFFCLLALASFLLLWRACQSGDAGTWIGFTAVSAINLHQHLFTVFVLASEAMIVMMWWLAERRPPIVGGRRRVAAIAIVCVLIFTAAAWPLIVDWIWPLGRDLVAKSMGDTSAAAYTDQPRFEIDATMWRKATRELILWRTPYRELVPVAVGLFLVGAMYGFFWLGRRREMLAVLIWVALPPWPIALFSHASQIDYGSRRLIFLVPFVALAIALGVQALAHLVHAPLVRAWRRMPRAAVEMAVVGWVVWGLASTAVSYYYLRLEKGDFKRLAHFLGEQARPGDLIVAWKPEHLRYYYQGPNEILDIRAHGRRLPALYATAERLWYSRPRSVANLPDLRSVEDWLKKIDALDLRFGGGQWLAFDRRQPGGQAVELAERVAIVEAIVAAKPGRDYLHAALAESYRLQGRKKEARQQKDLARQLGKR